MERREKRGKGKWKDVEGNGRYLIYRFPYSLIFQLLNCCFCLRFYASRFTFYSSVPRAPITNRNPPRAIGVSRLTFHTLPFTLYILSITILTFCLILPTGELAAQEPPPPIADDDASETKTEEASETPPDTDQSVPEASTDDDAAEPSPEDASEPPPTTDQPAPEEPADVSRSLDPANMSPEEGELIAKGDDLSFHNNLIQIHGNGLIKYEEIVLYADHIWADFNENVMRAAGNVRLLIENEETFANELIYNIATKKGIIREGFTYSDPWYYRGSEIFKVEDDESYIRGGSLTTCSLKHPHFYFSASQIIVKINKELIAKHVVLRVGGIPLFYFPAYRRDLRQEDKVAKIIVKIGMGSYQGAFLSVILPLSRAHRFNGALLFDQSSRRRRGAGYDGGYRLNDVKFQEILIPLPPGVTPSDRTKLEEKAEELSDRLQGKYDRYKLRQIFLEYKINEEDIATGREKAEEVYTQLQAEDADFAEIAEDNSTHQDTRYQGGDMGFLVRRERDKEGELRLDPILEEAVFQLQPGEITPILRTEFAFHILTVDRELDVYDEREIQVRRIDIAIEASQETRDAIQNTAKEIHARASVGEPLAQLSMEYEDAEFSEVNEGQGLLLNEMDRRWQYSVKRLEQPGEITRTVNTDRGVYLFELIEKEPTPSFEEVARQFEAEWETWKTEVGILEEPEDEIGGRGEKVDGGTEEGKEERKKGGKKGRLEEEKEGDKEDKGGQGDRNTGTQEDNTQHAIHNTQDDDIAGQADEEKQEEGVQVYQQHGFQGRWETPREIYSQTQRLDRGEASRVTKTRKGFHVIKVDKKRTYRGDIYFYTNDEFSFNRRNPFKTGQRWTLRWGHRHAIYTPWDSREKGRRPVSFVGRVAWRAKDFKEEGFGTNESTVNSFGMLTWGAAFKPLDYDDRDEDGNLKFSFKTIGEFLGRFQINHTLDLTGEGTTTLQKLPALELSLSRMRLSRLPVFKTLNSGLTKVADILHTDFPIVSMVGIPTLEDMSFDLDLGLGNFFRERFREKEDIFLQTMDLGFDLRKQSTLQVIPNRELRLDLDFDTNLIWHDKDQEGNRNIFRGVYSTRVAARNTLFRIYDISFIPGARRMRHQINSRLTFDFAPPVDREDSPMLYPFGPSVYFFERKRLSYNFDTSIEVKTRRSRSALRVLHFDTRISTDFTRSEALGERRYIPIESRLTIVPLASRNLNIRIKTTHDPNESLIDGKRFKQVGFRSNMSYRRKKWNVTLGNAFTKRTRRASRSITGSFRYRPSPLLEFDFSTNYDWIEKQFYSQGITIRRNLHGWNMTIRWNRIGIKRDPPFDNVRQDFTFQVNLIAEPAASVGLGYDATTDTWGFRSLPAGVPYNAFGAGNSLGRSYF